MKDGYYHVKLEEHVTKSKMKKGTVDRKKFMKLVPPDRVIYVEDGLFQHRAVRESYLLGPAFRIGQEVQFGTYFEDNDTEEIGCLVWHNIIYSGFYYNKEGQLIHIDNEGREWTDCREMPPKITVNVLINDRSFPLTDGSLEAVEEVITAQYYSEDNTISPDLNETIGIIETGGVEIADWGDDDDLPGVEMFDEEDEDYDEDDLGYDDEKQETCLNSGHKDCDDNCAGCQLYSERAPVAPTKKRRRTPHVPFKNAL